MGNREWFVWVSSTPVAAWFDELFEHDWKLSKKGGLGAVALLPESILPGGMMAFAAVPATEFDVQSLKACKVFPVISPDNYQQVLASHLQNAERSICIQQQYITAGEGVNDLLAILEKKKKAGIKIRILVSPKFPEYWNLSVKTLTAANLDSSLRASNLKYIIHNHNKGVLIDDRYSLVSSTNWSENSITRARETGLMIDSEEASAYYQSVFDFDWRVGLEPNTLVKAFALVAQADMV